MEQKYLESEMIRAKLEDMGAENQKMQEENRALSKELDSSKDAHKHEVKALKNQIKELEERASSGGGGGHDDDFDRYAF